MQLKNTRTSLRRQPALKLYRSLTFIFFLVNYYFFLKCIVYLLMLMLYQYGMMEGVVTIALQCCILSNILLLSMFYHISMFFNPISKCVTAKYTWIGTIALFRAYRYLSNFYAVISFIYVHLNLSYTLCNNNTHYLYLRYLLSYQGSIFRSCPLYQYKNERKM